MEFIHRRHIQQVLMGSAAIILAGIGAWIIRLIYEHLKFSPETAVLIIWVAAALAIFLPVAIYMLLKRKQTDPTTFIVVTLSSTAVVLVAVYFFQVSYEILFPADILIWSESDFVNDILKLRIGYPLYTDQVNNDSFVYPPGAQVVTWILSSWIGKSTSVPVFRTIQLLFTVLASFVATGCVQVIVRGSNADADSSRSNLLWFLIVPLLFLFATNSITNPFVHNLHNDSFSQLLTVIAFLLLLLYAYTPKKSLLIWMAILPTLGFFVKQNLIIWAVFYCVYLAVFDRPRSIRKILLFSAMTFGLFGMAYLVAYLLYGQNYYYWVIQVLGEHGVSPLRSFQHLLDVWLYVAIGMLAGVILLRGKNFKILIGPWLIWLVFISIEIYTSGIAWMINHVGPGSLLAGILFIAALRVGFPQVETALARVSLLERWYRALSISALLLLLMSGLGFIRVPVQSLSDDAYRYIDQIESEFEGLPAENILLDVGTWIYLADQIVMKDRAPSIGERGYSNTGDFSALLQRIEQQKYSKIILRNLHNPDFWYDHYLWNTSSGIRAALLNNYQEIRRISPVEGGNNYLLGEINVLVPVGK